MFTDEPGHDLPSETEDALIAVLHKVIHTAVRLLALRITCWRIAKRN